ncbi:MAG: glycosyltransferase family 39 protein [Acidobacteriota bacterium]
MLRPVAPRWRDLTLALVAALGALLVRLSAPGRGIDSLYDEGIVAGAAWRVLHGDVPYVDFWHLHPPGTAWLVAVCFRLFGTSLAVERGLDAAVFAASTGLVCALARVRSGRVVALVAAGLFALSPCETTSLRPRDLGLLFVLAALGACLAFFERPARAGWLVASGALVGASAWFKQDFAAAAAAAMLVAILMRTEARREERARNGFVLAASSVAAFLPVPAVLFVQGALGDAWRQAIVFPATRFESVRGLSIAGFGTHARALLSRGAPWRDILAAATPLIVHAFVVAGLILTFDLLRRRESRASVLLLGLGLLGLFLTARVRADAEHLLPPFALALVLLAWWVEAPTTHPLACRAAGVAAACLLALLAVAAASPNIPNVPSAGVDEAFRARAEGLTGADPDFLLAAADVAGRTKDGEAVFCGNARHDVTSVNPALFYFVAGRPNATRYDNLHPGVVTTSEVQREIVRYLEAKRVRVVVLWKEPGIAEMEAASPRGAGILDAHIQSTFARVRAYGRYEVCVRGEGQAASRDASLAAAPPK